MLYTVLGCFFVGLGILGIPLPILPTTPFLLLAAGCFAKSSPRLHKWLLNHPIFGKMIQDWQEKRCIAKKTKLSALLISAGFGGYSIFFVIPNLIGQIVCALLLAYGLYFVARIPACNAINHD